MKRSILLAIFLALGSGTVVSAQTFSVSGPGGSVPDYTGYCGPWNTQPNWPVFTSSVYVGDAVRNVTMVSLIGWSHDTRNQIQVYLTDPNGVRYNIIVRPDPARQPAYGPIAQCSSYPFPRDNSIVKIDEMYAVGGPTDRRSSVTSPPSSGDRRVA